MDPSGIEMVSVKSISGSPGLGQVNRGYEDVDHEMDTSVKDRSDGGVKFTPSTDAGQYMKKDSSSVDFTLPEKIKNRSGDRSKSIGGDDHYRERSKSISEGPYRGMGKEELLRFSSRPLWRNLRYACMSIVLTGWLALLITVVALVLTYPNCREAHSKDWWQKTVIYRIYVRSFLDTDGNGIGDLNGIRQKLSYLEETGVNTISLSPIYELAMDATTDTHIVDHQKIDPVFGTMDDFKALLNETHSRGMHILLDFVPNHTSDQHPWFNMSKSNPNPRENSYRSYYVRVRTQTANALDKPNNWKSVYGGPAWKLETSRNFHYLHQFLETQPELNLRSEKVREELEEILQFWLDLGVDGFYIRDSDFLFEDYDLRDDELLDNSTRGQKCGLKSQKDCGYRDYDHRYTRGLTEVFDMFARWRAFLDDKGNETGSYKMLVADVDGTYEHVMHYYGLFNRDGVDFPLNKFSLGIRLINNGQDVANMVSTWMSQMPSGRWANWMGGDDRSPRLTERLGDNMAMPYLMLTMLLPGTPYLYYGDEIGMREVGNNGVPAWGRNQSMRGPMQWDDQQWAGFCDTPCSRPWMDPNPDSENSINVKAQKNNPYSMWHLFKNLTRLRSSSPSFEYGDYIPSIQDHEVFSFVREFDGEKGYLVALNFVNRTVKKHLSGTHSTIPGGATIEVISGVTSRTKGDSLGLDPVHLEPYQGVVVSWAYKAKEL